MGIINYNEVAQRLTTSEDPLRLLIDTIPALIHTAKPDGSLDFFNKGWLDYLGLPSEDVCRWGWQRIIHPEDVAGLVDYWERMLESGKSGEAEARVRRFDGVYRWFWFRIAPLYDGTGKLI